MGIITNMSAINRGRKKAIPGIYTRLKKKE